MARLSDFGEPGARCKVSRATSCTKAEPASFRLPYSSPKFLLFGLGCWLDWRGVCASFVVGRDYIWAPPDAPSALQHAQGKVDDSRQGMTFLHTYSLAKRERKLPLGWTRQSIGRPATKQGTSCFPMHDSARGPCRCHAMIDAATPPCLMYRELLTAQPKAPPLDSAVSGLLFR